MADVTKVQASDGTIYIINDEDDYTKDEIDAMLANKANVGVSYTKAEDDALLADGLVLKADKDVTYTKAEVDDLLDAKAGVGDSYTKTEDDALLATKADKTDVDDALLLKADKAHTYTKSETDAFLADKADVGDSYTKAEEDALLADKANVGDSYTKAEDDALLADKADSTEVYTKAEVDALIGGIKMMPLLDWANPLFTFGSAGTSFTASEDCYLYGSISLGNGGYVSVNGAKVHAIVYGTSTNFGWIPVPIRLTSGDVVTVYNDNATIQNLGVYKERSV